MGGGPEVGWGGGGAGGEYSPYTFGKPRKAPGCEQVVRPAPETQSGLKPQHSVQQVSPLKSVRPCSAYWGSRERNTMLHQGLPERVLFPTPRTSPTKSHTCVGGKGEKRCARQQHAAVQRAEARAHGLVSFGKAGAREVAFVDCELSQPITARSSRRARYPGHACSGTAAKRECHAPAVLQT